MIQCHKQTTVAVIMKDGKFISMGMNNIHVDMRECPRDVAGYKSGEGYHLCKEVCMQNYHAEVDACVQAGEDAKGATLYLMGHTYCCDNCKKTMDEYGITKIVIPDSPLAWTMTKPEHYKGSVANHIDEEGKWDKSPTHKPTRP